MAGIPAAVRGEETGGVMSEIGVTDDGTVSEPRGKSEPGSRGESREGEIVVECLKGSTFVT